VYVFAAKLAKKDIHRRLEKVQRAEIASWHQAARAARHVQRRQQQKMKVKLAQTLSSSVADAFLHTGSKISKVSMLCYHSCFP